MFKFTEKKLLIASGNKGKITEIGDLLEPYSVEVVAATDFDVEEPEENGSSFTENALIKAKYYSQQCSLPALADDSGLCVEALSGDPGIYSARWAGEDKNFAHAMEKIQQKLGELENPSMDAYFVCVLAIYKPDGTYKTFEGRVDGKISFPARGSKGFGYDPIFVPDGYEQTFAQMEPAEKHQISHRAKAFKLMVSSIF